MINANILIVDNSVAMTESLKDALEPEGHTTIISNDGKNIIEQVNKHCIDIILFAIDMPQANVFNLLQTLKNTKETMDIPVVILTALDSASELQKALDLGAVDFIHKSAKPIEIIIRINSSLKLKNKHGQLLRSVQIDPLTQLYNKQYFNIAFESLVNEKSKWHKGVALIMIDCDHFKNINDQFGHTFGDQVLTDVANVISTSIKQTDIVCRFGGEKFCVILLNITTFQAYSVAERIRTTIIEKITFTLSGEASSLTVSCGISHTDMHDNKSSLQLVSEADVALYEAKRNGRNQTMLLAGSSN